jgi:endonuclease YncB( thermonuclease family)
MQLHHLILFFITAVLFADCSVGPGTSPDKQHRKSRKEQITHADSRPKSAITLTGTAVKIVDGDTFDLLDSAHSTIRVRLHGIDCPERRQDFYRVAKNYLSTLIAAKTVRAEKFDTDRWGRSICMVYVANVNVNEAMLKAGLAWHYEKYDQNPEWAALQQEAVKNRRGLWSLPNPVAPWDWRHH